MNHINSESKITSYQRAGVNVELADRMIRSWQTKFNRTARKERINLPMGFSGLFEVPKGYDIPVLVSSTDGVGTKLKLASELNHHHTIGIDLVAMCVNDVITCGAEPLYFLDYYAGGKLDPHISNQIIDGIVTGCELAHTDLIGGETAEMPGMYVNGEYDLAGFCVGIVEKSAILDGSQVTEGDSIVGLASSGFHANGYSLIRKIISDHQLPLTAEVAGQSLSDLLMAPTVIYVKTILNVISSIPIHALAHITGGGIVGNLARVIPDKLSAKVYAHSWARNPVFDWIQRIGSLSDLEMLETFNCGMGMVAIVPKDSVPIIRSIVESNGIATETIGTIVKALDYRKVVME